MSGFMVTTRVFGAKEFYMVNNDDPKRACEDVIRATSGRLTEALAPLSDETLAHFEVLPNEPWLCFRANPQPGANIGEGWGISQTAFSDRNIESVGRCELRYT